MLKNRETTNSSEANETASYPSLGRRERLPFVCLILPYSAIAGPYQALKIADIEVETADTRPEFAADS